MASRINWKQHLEVWQTSGLSQSAYCRLHRLNISSFSAKLREHRASESTKSLPVSFSLAPVQITSASPTHTEPLRLRTASGHCLELPASAEPGWLAELLRCLG